MQLFGSKSPTSTDNGSGRQHHQQQQWFNDNTSPRHHENNNNNNKVVAFMRDLLHRPKPTNRPNKCNSHVFGVDLVEYLDATGQTGSFEKC